MARTRKKADLPVKTCATCGRPMQWRRKWAKVWDEVRYCSDRCRGNRTKGVDGSPPRDRDANGR
jgi:hypothetical protein